MINALMEQEILVAPARKSSSTTLRDVAAVVFRHRGLVLSVFAVMFLMAVAGTWMLPKRYESSMKILVKRERVDPMVSAQQNSESWVEREVSPEDINSEVQLLKSRDLLEKVVLGCGLHSRKTDSFFNRLLRKHGSSRTDVSEQAKQIPVAVMALEKALQVKPIPKSKLINISYEATDPDLAAKALQTLAELYLDKHLAVHRQPGTFDFFQQQTQHYQKSLSGAEQRLTRFSVDNGVVSVELEKDITLRKLSEFEAELRQTEAAATAVAQRIHSLELQAAATPVRVATQVRTSDNPYLLQQLKTTILNLELKRTELLAKFEPGYRLVQEVDAEIKQAQEALAQAERNSLRDEVTDLDRTHAWLDEELARARAELATLNARTAEIARTVQTYRDRGSQISRKEMEEKDLARAAKTAEENYLLYLRKQEESRISEALDQRRIVNVAIAEAATVPALPSSVSWQIYLVLGLILAVVTSLGSAFAVDSLTPAFRTPDEVERYLGVPVLAATPWTHRPKS
jgi:uncharacterized protein involved in exopolysaccharide biosynthesis